MSDNAREACPPAGELLRITDGEGTTSERRAVSAHLWNCERCRHRLEELESLASECASAFAASELGPDEHRQFAEGLHRHTRDAGARQRGPVTWLATATAVAAVLLLVVLSQSQTATVQAGELLDRASRFQLEHQSRTNRVRIRWTPVHAGARSRSHHSAVAVVRSAPDGVIGEAWAAEPTLRMLAAHGLDWRRPLSIDAIRRWRLGLRRAYERVSEGDGLLTLRVRTDEPPLSLVEITVRSETYEPVHQALVVNEVGRLDVEVLSEPSPLRPAAPSDVKIVSQPRRTEMPPRNVLEQIELRARHALHQTRLDLGSRVRVSIVADQRVLVEGVAAEQAARLLKAKLTGEPHLEVELRMADARPTHVADAVDVRLAAPIQEWLDRTFDDDDPRANARFLFELSETTQLVSDRLTALVELDRRYAWPPITLAPQTRASLQALLDSHYADLNEALERLAGKVAVLEGSSFSLPIALTNAPQDWSRRIRNASRDVSGLVRASQAVANADSPTAFSTSRQDLSLMFGRVWYHVNQ